MPETKNQQFLFFAYFLGLGIISSLLQMVFLREVLISFRGNELFLNYFLIIWLTFVGLGSLAVFKKSKNDTVNLFFGFYYFVVCLASMFFFLAIRISPAALNFSIETPNLLSSSICIPLILLPITFLLGAGFSRGSKYFRAGISDTAASNVNCAYLTETFGFFAGALIFNFWLIKIPALKLILFIVVFGLMINAIILLAANLRFSKKFGMSFLLPIIFIAGLLLLFRSEAYELKTSNWRFPEKLIQSRNSLFGNIAVTEKNGQYNFYENGSLVAPPEDFQTSEELIHLPLLFTENPKKILIIGNAWNGLLKEVLKYPEAEIFYVELDPEILTAVYNFLSPEQQKELKNKRVTIINQDAFSYLKSNLDSRNPISKFDFILLNLASPVTYQANRYYTKEFFEILKENLTSEGVFSFSLDYYWENLENDNINRFIASVFKSFDKIFSENILLAGQKMILTGLKNKNLKWNIQSLAESFKKGGIKTKFLSVGYIEYLLANDRSFQILKKIQETSVNPNTNWSPSAAIYRIISQAEIGQPTIAHFLNQLLNHRWFILGLLILTPLLLVLRITRKGRIERFSAKIKFIAFSASSLSIIWELILIFVWQSAIGYIYHQISLIIGLIMLGVFLANLHLHLRPAGDKVKILKIFLLSLFLLSILFLFFILNLNRQSLLAAKIIILSFAVLSAYLAGGIYPLTNHLYLKRTPVPLEETGKIYGIELLGGAILLIIFSLFLLPFTGLVVFAAFLIYWSSLNLFLAKNLSGENVQIG